MPMRDDILEELLPRLLSDYRFRQEGDWLRKGVCPQCNRKEMYARADSPWTLRCPRGNKCGWEGDTKDLYPEIFDNWSKRHKQTDEAPNAAADAYLRAARGLKLDGLRGCYSQESYVDHDRRISSATVRFPLPGGSHWERLIDQPGRFEKKAHFKKGASYKGHWWMAPDQDIPALAQARRIFIAEGIFDALSLRQAGEYAVSAMTVYNYPAEALKRLAMECAAQGLPQPELVFAFDVGAAGTEMTLKFAERARDEGWRATAAQPRPEGEDDKLDWNDLLRRDRLAGNDPKGRPWIDTYLWHGQVLLAETATDKALLLWERHKWSGFSFVFDSRTWWASLDQAKLDDAVRKEGVTEKFAAKSCIRVEQIANCAFRLLYFQQDKQIDESHYYLRIDMPRRPEPVKAAFSGGQIAASAEFKKRLLSVAPGALWEGSGLQLDRMIGVQERSLVLVETLPFTGYSREHETWVLGDLAVRGGKVFPINAEDYFALDKFNLKLKSTERLLVSAYDSDTFPMSWIGDFWTAWGTNGMVTLTFWVMTWFAEQIRRRHQSLGFLEMSGMPGTGKSTIIKFLWKITGMASEGYEGIDPSKSTLAGYIRNLAKVGNLPVIFMEADRDTSKDSHSKKFDWSEIKPLFTGEIGRSIGVRTGGTETREYRFRGGLIIEQNAKVQSEAAVMERIMHTPWTKDGWSRETKAAVDKIIAIKRDDVSGTMIHVLRREADYLAEFDRAFPQYERHYLDSVRIRNDRVLLCHAQLQAGLSALAKVFSLPTEVLYETQERIDAMARDRDRVIEADNEVVLKFWEAFDWLVEVERDRAADQDAPRNSINLHRRGDELIAVNLLDFEAKCAKEGIPRPTTDELKKHLGTSKSRPFVEAKTVNCVDGRVRHCWLFKNPEHRGNAK